MGPMRLFKFTRRLHVAVTCGAAGRPASQTWTGSWSQAVIGRPDPAAPGRAVSA